MITFLRLFSSSAPLALVLLSTFWSCAPIESNQQALRPNPPQEIVKETRPSVLDLDLVETLSLQHSEEDEGSDTEELAPPEPSTTIAVEVQDLEKIANWQGQTPTQLATEKKNEIEYDFPITINRQVDYYLDFFQNRSRKSFARWLARSGRYVPMITEKLQEAGLPKDLAYLPMIESGYALNAYSSAKAVGPWQFMRATAIHFGLKVDNYVDERRDPIKSTEAAITYLKTLHDEFNSWELAVAGYNAGEGRIRKAIKKYNTTDFWKIAEQRYLPSETKLYVPKLIAAIIIAKSPEKYGFTEIDYAAAMDFEYASVPRWTTIQAIATALNAAPKELYELNRELRKKITPPDQAHYNIKIPTNSTTLLAQNLPRVHSTVTTKVKYHKISKRDTLNKICKRYNLNKTTLLKANNLHKAKLTPGKILRIPYQVTQYVLLSEEEMKNANLAQENGDFILHKIRPGETVGQVARRYNVSTQLIATWNDLANINKIRAGQQLALYINTPHTTTIAQKSTPHDNVALTAKTKIITLTGSQKIAVGNSAPPAATTTYYKVRGGDSLWEIARRFNLHTADIKRWNKLKNNTIHPGLRLRLELEADA